MHRKIFTTYSAIALIALIVANDIFGLEAFAQEIPKAQCVSAYGETKCGYNCVTSYGEIKCAEWPGGVCKASYGEIVCGPPAPSNWLDFYTNRGRSNSSRNGVYGAWAVRSESGKWNGILRMRGLVGTLVYVSNAAESLEIQMDLKRTTDGGYLLEGKYITWHNLRRNYLVDNFYFQNFGKNFSVNACNKNRHCYRALLTYIGE